MGLMALNSYLTNRWIQRLTISVMEKPLGASLRLVGDVKLRITSFFKIENIIHENQKWSEENRRLKAENLKINELMRENEFLREELGVAQKRGFKLEVARIFHFNVDGPFRTALIDKGAEQDIMVGQPVVFSGDILLGVVREVYPRQALVYLLNDPRLTLNVQVVDSLVVGRTQGALERGIVLELITNQEEVREGETVVTSGLDGLPRLLVVGKISNVQTKSGDLFRAVRVDPEFENLILEDVFIIKN